MVKRRKEDDADRWLREHDPYYASKDKNKRQKEEYHYDTIEQEHRKSLVEIPLSTLTPRQRRELKNALGAYDDSGEFNL